MHLMQNLKVTVLFFFTPGYLGKVTLSNISSCIGFYVGKTFEFSYNRSDYVALVPFELEHLDAWGLAPLASMGGNIC